MADLAAVFGFSRRVCCFFSYFIYSKLKMKINSKLIRSVASIFLVGVLSACATRSDIVSEGVRNRFVSTLPALKLAMCIDRNVDENSALGSLVSKIINSGAEPVEVVVRNGATTYAVVQIRTSEGGSSASFFYGGVANMFPDDAYQKMTTGCK